VGLRDYTAAMKRKAEGWRAIVASSIDWEQAHTSFDTAVAKLPPRLRGRRPKGFPHSPWELVEHIRMAQADLLEFMTNRNYSAPVWPDDYWPKSPSPTGAAWSRSLSAIKRDRQRLKRLVTSSSLDLTGEIPWGGGKTYLRTILVAVDHESYHVGQLIAVRRLLGNWK
jgi:uncharacterized damage-inducible protein DinB